MPRLAAGREMADDQFTVTVLRVFRGGRAPEAGLRTERDAASLRLVAGDVEARFGAGRVQLSKGGRQWTVALPQ